MTFERPESISSQDDGQIEEPSNVEVPIPNNNRGGSPNPSMTGNASKIFRRGPVSRIRIGCVSRLISPQANTDDNSRDPLYLPTTYSFHRIAGAMPHLQYCNQQVRNAYIGQSIQLDIFEMSENGSADGEIPINSDTTESASMKYSIHSDLTPRVIEHLWSTQWMNPDFFETHLHRSGYAHFNSDEHPPSTWNTRSFKKTYGTIKWMRPVTIPSSRPINLDQVLQIIKEPVVKVSLQAKANIIDTDTVRLVTNIYRQEIALTCDPAEQSVNASDTDWYPAALEERTTINYGVKDGCKIGKSVSRLLMQCHL
jgi:hypothetical protein